MRGKANTASDIMQKNMIVYFLLFYPVLSQQQSELFYNNCLDFLIIMDQIQTIQNKHRQSLIDYWNIAPSSRILEIGCGQGDTTALLAKTVGENGFIHAIDPAPGSYGAPVTLGEARLKLLNSDIGKNIRIDLNTDIFSPALSDKENSFDYVVLSHCSWYFKSTDLLYKSLQKARQFAKSLCFAEWDIRITSSNQLNHYQAVLIQAQCSSFQKSFNSNIQTLFTLYDVLDLAKKAGWNVTEDTVIDSSYLQDGEWEIKSVLDEYPQIIHSSNNIPDKMKDLLFSEIRLLNNSLKVHKADSLNTFAFVAL